MTLNKQRRKCRRGFSLLMVLMAVSGLGLIMIVSLKISNSARVASGNQSDSWWLDLAYQSAQEDAVALAVHTTNRDNFITHLHSDAQGDPSYYLISWFDPASSQWNHQPLYSGAPLEQVAAGGQLDRYVPYTSDLISLLGKPVIKMQELGHKFSGPGRVSFDAPRVVLSDTGGAEVSYSYWIEDLNGLLDYEALSYDDGSPDHSYEQGLELGSTAPLLTADEIAGRAELKMVDQRHLGLNVFSNTTIADTEYPIDWGDPLGKRLSPADDTAPVEHSLHEIFASNPAVYSLNAEIVASEIDPQYANLDQYLTVGLPNTYELESIPFGHDYPNAWVDGALGVRLDLNELVARAEGADAGTLETLVTELADQIKNVPGFKDNDAEYEAAGVTGAGRSHTRYGGLDATESYCKTLAASIIDYADQDSNSTSIRRPMDNEAYDTAPANSLYRGMDSMPLLTDWAKRYQIVGGDAEGVFVEVRTFLEIWNPSNQEITGYLRYEFQPHESHHVVASNVDYPLPAETLYYWNGQITLAPNQYRTIEVTVDSNGDYLGEGGAAGYPTYEIPTASETLRLRRGASAALNKCRISWFDGSSGAPSSEGDFRETCGFHSPFNITSGWIALHSKLDKSYSLIGHPMMNEEMVGDPRSNIYCRTPVSAVTGHRMLSFEGSATFGGANHYLVGQSNARQMSPEIKFPDGSYSHSVLSQVPPRRNNMKTVNSLSDYIPGEFGYFHNANPDNVLSSTPDQPYDLPDAQDALRYIQPISNRGIYVSLGELGNIYDPAQWREPKRQTTHVGRTDLPDGAGEFTPTLASDYEQYGQDELHGDLDDFGGGITLAIGSPEFNAFDPYVDPTYDPLVGGGREGYQAARLVDQFRVTSSPLRSLKSRINLNTAPPQVLAALFSGLTLDSDQLLNGVGGITRQARLNSAPSVASSLVYGITEHRATMPFRSLSDIALTRAYYPSQGRALYAFGERALYEQNMNQAGVDLSAQVWSDEGREELFRRTSDLFTTKSRSYRVHLVAEYRKGGHTSRMNKSFDLSIIPQRDRNKDYAVDETKSPTIIIQNR